MSFSTIQREIRVNNLEENSDACLYVKVLGANDWLGYQQALYDLAQTDKDNTIAYSQHVIKYGKQWIIRIENVRFEDGSPLTPEDVDLLPLTWIVKAHEAVLEKMNLGKSKEVSPST